MGSTVHDFLLIQEKPGLAVDLDKLSKVAHILAAQDVVLLICRGLNLAAGGAGVTTGVACFLSLIGGPQLTEASAAVTQALR